MGRCCKAFVMTCRSSLGGWPSADECGEGAVVTGGWGVVAEVTNDLEESLLLGGAGEPVWAAEETLAGEP